MENTISGLKTDNFSLDESLGTTKKLLDQAESEIEKLEKDVSKLAQKLKASDLLLAAEIANRNRLAAEKEQLEARLAVLTSENLSFLTENTRLQQDLAKSINKVDILEDQTKLLAEINAYNHNKILYATSELMMQDAPRGNTPESTPVDQSYN